MTPSSAAITGAADPCRPPAAELLRDAAQHVLTETAEDFHEAARRLRWLAHGQRIEHGLEPAQWLSSRQTERLQRMADHADLIAADALATLEELKG